MVPSVVESVEKLWGIWSIRAMVTLSLLVQVFLSLLAPLRKQRGGKWIVMISIWLAYLLADWVPTFTIGLIFHAKSSETLAFWATFLLLHLGGSDSITSFSLEDNEFWIRHLLGLLLQVTSTVYVIYRSLPHNSLLLPTLTLLIAGIIKCVERNWAFYLACFDHYGDDENFLLLDVTEANDDEFVLEAELTPYGTIRKLLVGPLLSPRLRKFSRKAFLQKGFKDVLLLLEIEQSLLYEALHTKLPVVDCKIGYFLRMICLGCISGVFLCLNMYKLGEFEHWLSRSLLVAAITLDIFSIIRLLFFSDFSFLVRNSRRMAPGFSFLTMRLFNITSMWSDFRTDTRAFGGKGRRWSKTIFQCNFLTYFVNGYPSWLIKLAAFRHLRIISETIRGIRSLSSQNIREEQEWHFIFEELKRKAQDAETVEMGKNICLKRGDGILDSNEGYRHLIWSVKNLDYTKSLLMWHIATEICFQLQEDEDHRTTSTKNVDYRGISKLISDYMFYLLEMQPAMMATVSIDWKALRAGAYMDLRYFFEPICNERDLCKAIYSRNLLRSGSTRSFNKTILGCARKLARQLKGPDGIPWKLMSQVWVEIMCYAAINCRPNVHAQQPSKGGQLLTFVWLLMNHLGLGTQFSTEEPDDSNEEKCDDSDEV